MNIPHRVAAAISAFILSVAAGSAQTSLNPLYDIVKLDFPGSLTSSPIGINSKRQVAGNYVDTKGIDHGYIWSDGKFKTVDYPGSPGSGLFGINERGDVNGVYFDQKGFQHGFVYARRDGCDDDDRNENCEPRFTSIDVPFAVQNSTVSFEFGPGLGTASVGLNNRRQVVGMYATAHLFSDGFVETNGRYESIDAPGASHAPGNGTKIFAVNDKGVLAGNYLTQSGSTAPQITHAFLLEDGKYTSIDVPGSPAGGFGTQVNGINNYKQAAGVYSSASGVFSGFVWIEDRFYKLDYPGAVYSEVNGINDRGDLTGGYATDKDGTVLLGFVAFRKGH